MKTTLTTTGRRTGERRAVTLYAWPDADRYVLVGSSGGAAEDPAWVSNLRADPRATIKVGRATRAAVAREVADGERDRLWALVCGAFPMYATYQRRTARPIPLFSLEIAPSERPDTSPDALDAG